jgi:hypothetical protein
MLAGYYQSVASHAEARFASLLRRSDRARTMKERKPFGPWTLLVGIAWVVGTVMACIVIWRLWTSMPR